MSEPFRVDERRCLHETLDGDTIVIDSERGWLVVLAGIGSTIWELMVAGSVPADVVAEVDRRYGAGARADVDSLLDELISTGLIVPDPDVRPVSLGAATWPEAYVAPSVNRFDDVADILQMDPIHEVAVDEGWPNAPRPATGDTDR